VIKLATLIFVILALTVRSYFWWWAGACLVLDRIWASYYYSSRPWKKVHFPLMRLYARHAGVARGLAQDEDDNAVFRNALTGWIKALHQDWADSEIQTLLDHEERRCENFEDQFLVRNEIVRTNPKWNEARVEDVMLKARKCFDPRDRGFFVRFLIAAFIEEAFGEKHRAE
jgi:hypothetical protein